MELIAKERQRQQDAEGYDVEHDDGHTLGALAMAAALYAIASTGERLHKVCVHERSVDWFDPWPWDPEDDKRPKRYPDTPTRRQQMRLLTKAGALIAAELDRVQRIKA